MLNPFTFRQFDAYCLHLAKLAPNELNPNVRMSVINVMTHKIFGLLDGVNDPFWHESLVLIVAADQLELKDTVTNGGTLTALDSTAKTVTDSTNAFVAGSLIDVVMVTKATSLIKAQFKARIKNGGLVGTYVKIAGTEATFASGTDVLFINVMKTLSATTADLSSDYVAKIIEIFDDQGTGGNKRLFDLYSDPRSFAEAWDDPNMDNRIAALHYGDTVELLVGASATAPGVVQALIKGKPPIFTEATKNNTLGTPSQENAMLTDEVVAEFCRQANKPISDVVQKNLALYQKRYDDAAAARSKSIETLGQRSV